MINKDIKKKTENSLYLLLLFFTLLCYVLSLPTVSSDIATVLLLVCTFLKTPSLKFSYSSYHRWGAIVILFSLLSSLWSFRPILSYYATFAFIKLFILTYSIYRYCNTEEKLVSLLRLFILANLILVFFIISYFGFDILGKARMSDTENGINGNAIAISLTFAIYSICIIFFLVRKNFFICILYCVLGVLFFIFLVFTGSRTAIIMLFLPTFIYVFLSSKYKLMAIFLVCIIGVIMYFIVMKVPQFYNVLGVRLQEGMDIARGKSEQGDSSRLLLFLYGIEWFKDNPVFGVGINNYRVLSNATYPFIGKNFYAHSNVIEMLVDLGVVGFLVYYSFIFSLVRKVILVSLKSNLSKLVLALTVTIFIHDIFSMSYYEWEMHFIICVTFVIQSFAERNRVKIKS